MRPHKNINLRHTILVAVISTVSHQHTIADAFADHLRTLAEHHPALHSAEEAAHAAQARVGSADALPDPTVGLGVFGESIQTRTGPQEAVVNVNQGFPWFGVREHRRHTAEESAKGLEAKRDALELTLGRSLAAAFFEYAYLGKATELTRENLRLLQDLAPIVETRIAAGAPLNAMLRIQVETGKIQDQLQTLSARRTSLSAKLDELLAETDSGLRDWPVWQPSPGEDLEMTQLMEQLETQNPELNAQSASVNAASSRVEEARLRAWPEFGLGVTYIQVGDPEVNPMTPQAGEDPWSVNASIKIPLWRGAEKARQAEAKSMQRGEEARLEELNRSLKAELTSRLALYRDAQRRLQLYGKDLLGLASQAVENSRAAYENGTATVLEVIDSERSLLALQLEYWRVAADSRIHRFHLRSLTHPNLDSILAEEASP